MSVRASAAAGLTLAMAIGLSSVNAQEVAQPRVQACVVLIDSSMLQTEMSKMPDQLVLPPSPAMAPIKLRSPRQNPIPRFFDAKPASQSKPPQTTLRSQ